MDQSPIYFRFKTFGARNPHRPAEDIAFSVARFFQKGGSVQNYYMVFHLFRVVFPLVVVCGKFDFLISHSMFHQVYNFGIIVGIMIIGMIVNVVILA